MIECVNGQGQGCCCICLLISGFHREWSSSLYYVKNPAGLYLRKDPIGVHFMASEKYPRAAYCYKHALMVDDTRKTLVDWSKGDKS